eukprot:6921655-Prymnesium_polylepis.1
MRISPRVSPCDTAAVTEFLCMLARGHGGRVSVLSGQESSSNGPESTHKPENDLPNGNGNGEFSPAQLAVGGDTVVRRTGP